MRVIEQLIDHLRLTGHLTADQLDQLREMGLLKDKRDDYADYLDPFDSQPEIPRSIIESARSAPTNWTRSVIACSTRPDEPPPADEAGAEGQQPKTPT